MSDRMIKELGFVEHIEQSLQAAAVETLSQLLSMTRLDVWSLPGIGKKRLRRIEDMLTSLGYRLKPLTGCEMLSIALRNNECTGLSHPDCETGCHVSDLAPCGNIGVECRAVFYGDETE